MKKDIMNSEITIKTSQAGTELSMEGSLPAMESGIHTMIEKLSEYQGITFAEYCDNMKKCHAEVEEMKQNPMKMLEKLLGNIFDNDDEKSEFEEMLQSMMNGGKN